MSVSLVCLLVATCCTGQLQADIYEEDLTLIPLTGGFVETYFQFKTVADGASITSAHYHMFPKPLGEIISKYNVSELTVSLTEGMWRRRQWGNPLLSTASGAEVLAFFNEGTTNVEQQWKDLVNSLAGLFCASLNFIDKAASVKPSYSFRPIGAVKEKLTFDKNLIRHAILPHENVCTENLTPWIKLLPCHGKAGLSSLLNAVSLYDASYHSLSLTYKQVCETPACETLAHQLDQKLLLVYEPTVKSVAKDTWNMEKLFKSKIEGQCAIAKSSRVYVETSTQSSIVLNPDPVVKEVRHGVNVATYDVTPRLNIAATSTGSHQTKSESALIYAHRYLAGYGQEKGAIHCKIVNTLDENIQIVFMENIPWFFRTFLHSLKIVSDGVDVKPVKTSYTPARERISPHLLELLLSLPANSSTVISLDFERLFLKWTEYPPDANHGFYIPSAVILASLPDMGERFGTKSREGYTAVRIYTEKLLVSLPTPDFSMPYNVICLACTVVAIAFGSFHSLISKTFVEKKESDGLFKRIIGKVFKSPANTPSAPTPDSPSKKTD